MSWSDQQKQIAARAAAAAGMDDDARKFVLRQFPNSLFDRKGQATGTPSSTSSRLNQGDFEHYMAIVERGCPNETVLTFPRGYWMRKAADDRHRLFYIVGQLDEQLAQTISTWKVGTSLAAWIRERVPPNDTDELKNLNSTQLHQLINGLRAYLRRHGGSHAA